MNSEQTPGDEEQEAWRTETMESVSDKLSDWITITISNTIYG